MEIKTYIGEGVMLISQFELTQDQVSDLAPLVHKEVEKQQKIIMRKIRYLAEIAEHITLFGEWNGDTPASITEKLNLLFQEAKRLLTWEVKKKYSDTDKHGNTYSAMRQVGITASNPRSEYTFHSYK